jgi:hypothetical protein
VVLQLAASDSDTIHLLRYYNLLLVIVQLAASNSTARCWCNTPRMIKETGTQTRPNTKQPLIHGTVMKATPWGTDGLCTHSWGLCVCVSLCVCVRVSACACVYVCICVYVSVSVSALTRYSGVFSPPKTEGGTMATSSKFFLYFRKRTCMHNYRFNLCAHNGCTIKIYSIMNLQPALIIRLVRLRRTRAILTVVTVPYVAAPY